MKHGKMSYLAAVVVLALSGIAGGAAYYVDPVNGNDGNTGLSRTAAWGSLLYAIYHVPNGGGPLYLMTGNYPYTNLETASGYPTRTSYLLVTADPTSSPVIAKLRIANGNVAWYLDFYGVTFDYPDPGTQPPSFTYTCEILAGHNIKLRYCIVEGALQPAPGDPRYRSDYTTTTGVRLFQSGVSLTSCYDITIDHCTIRNAIYGVYCSCDNVGNGISITNNDISLTGAGGILTLTDYAGGYYGPADDPVLIQGNYIHEQAKLYTAGYLQAGVTHGTGIYLCSSGAIVNANVVDSYGNTASIRTYPVPSDREFRDLTITNNVIIHPVNAGFEFYNLGGNNKINHNTVIGCDRGAGGLYKFVNMDFNLTCLLYPHATFDDTDLEFCNNIFLCCCAPNIRITDGHMTGNLIWSFSDSFTQTAMDAALPGNIVYCDSTDDSNSVPFTTGGSWFAGGTWFTSHAFDWPQEVDSVFTAGWSGAPGHAFDLVAAADAVDFGTTLYTAVADFWGTLRPIGNSPDGGHNEYLNTTDIYYVDSAASEGGNGTYATPWDDLSDVTGLKAGDTVLLKRNSHWRQGLTISTGGSVSDPTVVGTYGSGSDPIIDGSLLVGGWTSAGGGSALWTETDPGADITVTTNRVTWTAMPKNVTSYVVRDMGTGHFSGDFTHKFQAYIDASDAGGWVLPWVVANFTDSAYLHEGTSQETDDYIGVYFYGTGEARLRLCQDGVATANYLAVTLDTLYYITVVRDDDAGANATGRVTWHVHTGDYHPSGTHVGEGYLDCGVGEQNDFRYVYAVDSWNNSSSAVQTGYTQNMDLGEGGGVEDFTATSGGNVWQASLALTPTQVFFDGTRGNIQASQGAVDSQYDWYYSGGTLYVYAASDPDTLYTSPGIEASVYPVSAVDGLLRATANWVRFEDIAVRKSACRGIEVEHGDNVVIRRCTVDWSWSSGVCFPDTSPPSSNATVEECDISYSNTCKIDGTEAHEGVTFQNVQGFIFRRNVLHNGFEEGLDCKYGATNGQVYENLIYSNGYVPLYQNIIQIYVDGGTHIDIYHNYIYGGDGAPYQDNVQGISLAMELDAKPTNNIRIWGNVIRDCSEGLRMWVGGAPTYEMDNLYIVNNTFYSCSDRAIYAASGTSGHLAAPITIRNNILWQDSGSAILDDSSGNELIATATITHNGFRSGQSSEALGSGYVQTSTAGFVNADTYDFALQSTSPFINAGADAGSPYYDCLGNTTSWPLGVVTRDQRDYGSGWDIGAYIGQNGGVTVFESDFYAGTSYPITVSWFYNSAGTTGKFICPNDVWVADSSGITLVGVTPAPGSATHVHAALDPYVGLAVPQGLSCHCSNYSASLDIIDTLDIGTPSTWVSVPAGTSIVFLREYATEQDQTWANAAAVLTVLASAPPANSFRPPWTGTNKAVNYNLASINFSALPKLTEPAGAPTFATCQSWFAYPVLDWALDPSDYPHGMARANLPRTGQELANKVNVATFKLSCNFTDAEKQALAAYLIQYGLDIWGILNANYGDYRGWVKTGTINLGDWYEGRLVPAALAAQALNHTALKAMLAKTGDYLWGGTATPSDAWYFAEAMQTHLVTEAEAGSGSDWIGCPDFASQGRRVPTWTGPGYPKTNELSAEPFVSAAMCLYLLGATGPGDFDALLDYADYRWQVTGGQFTQQSFYGDWQEEFYDHHRADYFTVHPYCYLLWPDAGSDQSVAYDQRLTVNLDANGSKNWWANQTQTTYTWKEGGSTIATGETPVVAFTSGTHTVTMELRDEASGDVRSDTVTITVAPGPDYEGWLLFLK